MKRRPDADGWVVVAGGGHRRERGMGCARGDVLGRGRAERGQQRQGALALQPAPERSHRVGDPLEPMRARRGRPYVVADETQTEQRDVRVLPAGQRHGRAAALGRRYRWHARSRRESKTSHAVTQSVARNAEPGRRLHNVAARHRQRGQDGLRALRAPGHRRATNDARPRHVGRGRRWRRRRVETEGSGSDLGAVGEQGGALDHVRQLAHIPRPRVPAQDVQGSGCQLHGPEPVVLSNALENMLREEAEVVTPLP
jgi:hypothetical protein